MLSDEEREALQYFNTETKTEAMHYGAVLVKLIEKQSKEIEHQKEKRENQKKELAILNAKQIEFNKLVNTVNSYKGQFKRQQKEIEELKEDKYGLEEEVQIQAKQLIEIDGNYISKEVSEEKEKEAWIKGTNDADELCNKKWEDKIKARIKEVQQRKENDGECELALHGFQREAKIEVLQSLLKKE